MERLKEQKIKYAESERVRKNKQKIIKIGTV